jgi:hypothetical protein
VSGPGKPDDVGLLRRDSAFAQPYAASARSAAATRFFPIRFAS